MWNTRVKDENGDDVFITSQEAASYITEEFCLAFETFFVTETLGCLPFSGGWAQQPAWITGALLALKTEQRKADEEERELRRQEEEVERKYGKRQ